MTNVTTRLAELADEISGYRDAIAALDGIATRSVSETLADELERAQDERRDVLNTIDVDKLSALLDAITAEVEGWGNPSENLRAAFNAFNEAGA